jgi:dihydroflavonol-4-reductase
VAQKVIVTGASGHIGFHVARLLLDDGYQVILLSRKENINTRQLAIKGATLVLCDLNRPDTYAEILKGAACVFHLAAENTTRTDRKEQVIENTLGLTKAFLDTVYASQVPVTVYTSSVVVLGRSSDPSRIFNENDRATYFESPYVEGKARADHYCEQLIRDKGMDIRRIYPSWVVGPGDSRLTPPHKIIGDYVAKGQMFYFNGGISIADVEEVAIAHIRAFEVGQKASSYVTAGENITFLKFYQLLAELTGRKDPVVNIPKWFIVMGAYATKPLFKAAGMQPIIDPGYARAVFGNFSWYNSTLAEKELEYKVKPASDILEQAVMDARRKQARTAFLGIKTSRNDPAQRPEKGKLLITGVPGWLGNRMVDIMINGDRFGDFMTSRQVKLLVQPAYKGYLSLPPNFEIVYGDLSDDQAIRKALEGVSTVFHLAGAIYPRHIKTLYAVNFRGTKNLVDLCIEKGIRRIIYMSTDSTAGKGSPDSRIFDENTASTPYKHYGKSKWMAEKYILDKTREGYIDGTSLRGFWFFGPFAPERQLSFFKSFYWKRQPVFGNGTNYRSISHIDDIIMAFFKAEKNLNTYGKWYWIASSKADLSVDELYRQVAQVFGVSYKPLYIPVWLCKVFGHLDSFSAYFGILHPTIHAAGKFYFDIAGTTDAALRDFDFNPRLTVEEAIREVKEMMV